MEMECNEAQMELMNVMSVARPLVCNIRLMVTFEIRLDGFLKTCREKYCKM